MLARRPVTAYLQSVCLLLSSLQLQTTWVPWAAVRPSEMNSLCRAALYSFQDLPISPISVVLFTLVPLPMAPAEWTYRC